MTKIAMIEVTVPDEIKEDQVFNHLRNKQCPMSLKSLVPNPNDPPLIETTIGIKVIFVSRNQFDVEMIKNDISIALQSIKGIKYVELS